MKAGTAQKMILNMLSTGTMIRLGKVYGNLMVDVKATNHKLEERARRIVMTASGCSRGEAIRALGQSKGQAKPAIVMLLLHISYEEAQKRLQAADGLSPAHLQRHPRRKEYDNGLQRTGPGTRYDLTGCLQYHPAYHCMTRLRLVVKEEHFTKEDIGRLRGVMGINKSGDEWQIILGPGKAQEVTREFLELLKKIRSHHRLASWPAMRLSETARPCTKHTQKKCHPGREALKKLPRFSFPSSLRSLPAA